MADNMRNGIFLLKFLIPDGPILGNKKGLPLVLHLGAQDLLHF